MDVSAREELGYGERIAALQSRIRDLAAAPLDVLIERGAPAPTRTAHTVRLRCGMREAAVVLSREEFLDEFGLFERAALPRLRSAIASLTANSAAAPLRGLAPPR